MDEIDIRPVAVADRRAATDALRAALLTGPVNDETFDRGHPSWDGADSIAAWDGDRCVGHVAAFRFDSTVPGGARLPTAAVTRVGVLPTHTRRGLLSRMLHQLLHDARANGQPLATLHASETSIYRRYGFGLATDAVAALVTTRQATPWRVATQPGTMRLLAHTEVLATVPALYEAVARWRVGSVSRPDWYWPRYLRQASEPAPDAFGKGTFVGVHSGDDGADDGYVLYEVDWDEDFATNPTGAGKVHDLFGASAAVELELWRYLLDIDLVTTWKADPRPVGEPTRRSMTDTRAYETRARYDEQWVRLLDVDAALSARTYGPASAALTIGVTDPMFAENTGSWTISSDGARRTDAVPDLTVDVATLSAAYLGGVAWHVLDSSGELDASPSTLQALDALFAVDHTPFCGTMY